MSEAASQQTSGGRADLAPVDAERHVGAVVVRLVSHRSSVRSNSGFVLGQVRSLFLGALASPSDDWTGSEFEVTELSANGHGPRYAVGQAGQRPRDFATLPEALARLEFVVGSAAMQAHSDDLLLHAAAVGTPAGAILIPADSGAGKSTLTAALCLAGGLEYLSDDVAVLELESLSLRPFLKTICVKDGGLRVLTDTFGKPSVALDAVRASGEALHYLRAPREAPPDTRLPVRYVLLPVRRVGATAALEPISRGQALFALASHSFNLPRHGGEGLNALARIAEEAECYRLTYGGLRDAVAAVASLSNPSRVV